MDAAAEGDESLSGENNVRMRAMPSCSVACEIILHFSSFRRIGFWT